MLRIFTNRVEPDKKTQDMTDIVNAHKVEVEEIKKEKEELLGSTKNIKEANEKLSNDNWKLDIKKQELQKDVAIIVVEKSELVSSKSEEEAKINTMKKSFEDSYVLLRDEQELLLKNIDSLRNDFNNSKTINAEIISDQEKEIENKKKENENLSNIFTNLGKRNSGLKEANLGLEELIKKRETELGSKEAALVSLNSNVNNTVNKLNSLKSDENVQSDKLISLQHNIDNLSDQITKLGEEEQTKKMSIANILIREEQINEKKAEILDLYKKAGIKVKLS